MARRQDELPGVAQTVYLGGGTPSVLEASALEQLFASFHRYFSLSPDAEITIEANPDDVDAAFCRRLKALGVNRVSLGVQSLNNARLRFLRRRHDAAGAVEAVGLLKEYGIDNISIDLIFGLPGQSLEEWQHDVHTALSLPVTHLSAYSLMVEEGTPLQRMVELGEVADTLPGGSHYVNSVLIGYAPADDPQIAMAVVLEYGGGGANGVPVMRAVLDAWFE